MSVRAPSITLYLGGVRAGKSARAQAHGESIENAHRIFIATAQAFDDEMSRRIVQHQSDRGGLWDTIEEPLAITNAIAGHFAMRNGHAVNVPTVVLIDCITLWVSNLLLAMADDEHTARAERVVGEATRDLVSLMHTHPDVHWILVSNEVGLGVVPPTPLGRAYRDALGRANQMLAEAATHVQLMVAGLELQLK